MPYFADTGGEITPKPLCGRPKVNVYKVTVRQYGQISLFDSLQCNDLTIATDAAFTRIWSIHFNYQMVRSANILISHWTIQKPQENSFIIAAYSLSFLGKALSERGNAGLVDYATKLDNTLTDIVTWPPGTEVFVAKIPSLWIYMYICVCVCHFQIYIYFTYSIQYLI